MSKLSVISTKIKDGNFTIEEKYFPNLTEEERILLYNTNLEKLGIKRENAVILNEDNQEEGYLLLKEGKIKNTTKKEAVVMKSSLEDFFILVETSDSPVMIGSVTKKNETTVVVALGTLKNLKNEILDKMVGYLIHATGCAPFDMTFYISSCPNKEDYIIKDQMLVESRIFKDAIEKKKDGYHLDIRLAIFNDLYNQIVNPDSIYFDSTNSVEKENSFSEIGKRPGKKLVGIVFQKKIIDYQKQ